MEKSNRESRHDHHKLHMLPKFCAALLVIGFLTVTGVAHAANWETTGWNTFGSPAIIDPGSAVNNGTGMTAGDPVTIDNGDNIVINGAIDFDYLDVWGGSNPLFTRLGNITTSGKDTGYLSIMLPSDAFSSFTINSIGTEQNMLRGIDVYRGNIVVTQGIFANEIVVEEGSSISANEVRLQNGKISSSGKFDVKTLDIDDKSTVVFSSWAESKIEKLRIANGSTLRYDDFTNGTIERIYRNQTESVTNELEVSSDCTIEMVWGSTLTIGSDSKIQGADGKLKLKTDYMFEDTGREITSRFYGNIVGDGEIIKIGNDTWAFEGKSDFSGQVTIKEGVLEACHYRAFGEGTVKIEENGTLRIGNLNDRINKNVLVYTTLLSNNGNLDIVVGATGRAGSLTTPGVFGNTNITISGEAEDINRWGGYLQFMPEHCADLVVTLDTSVSDTAFSLVGANGKEVNQISYQDETFSGFETSRYGFKFGTKIQETADGVDVKSWGITGVAQNVIVPDLSTMVLTNIIGFEIPRAQNVNGPWVRTRGGEINDDKAQFDKTTYQTVQVGWDKTFGANNKGSWNAGIFFEGDWSYGRGNWHSLWGTINGNLKSSVSGIGAGLYASRGLENGWYVDAIGRMNVFENEVNMNTDDTDNNYKAGWSSSLFNLALEVGKDFESKDGLWTFNPYNRLIYTNAPSEEFNVTFGDLSIVKVNNNTIDAWTNKLGGRLAYKLNYCKEHQRSDSVLFVGADWYKGISGDFTTKTYDTLNSNATWNPIKASHPKNDLDYGTATLGMIVMPKDNIALTAQTDLLFGDVEGWAVGLSGRISF